MEMSGAFTKTRRHMQAESIVNSLKLRTKKCNVVSTKKLKKHKRRFGVRRNSQSDESAEIPSDRHEPWFRDVDGRVKQVKFCVNRPAAPKITSAPTFSSLFKEVAKKFKDIGPFSESIQAKVFCDKENERVHLLDVKNGEDQLENYGQNESVKQKDPNVPFLEKMDFEQLKNGYKLSYLY